MKELTIFWMFAMLLLSGLVFAGGEQEKPVVVPAAEPERIEVTLAHGFASYYQPVLDQFARDFPNVDVNWVKGDVVDGLFALETPPNVFMATPGGVGKYLIPGYALELTDENIADLSDYKPGTLDAYVREGELLAIPVCIAVNALNINLTMAEYVGFDVPSRDFLTIDEVLEFFELIKQKAPDGYYGTAIFAGNGGSQQANINWLAGFGATMFEDGDYSKTTINSPETLAALEFIKYIVDSGYTEPYSEVLDDDETLSYWGQGRYGLHWMRAGGMFNILLGAVEQGLIPEAFDNRFMSYPRAPGTKAAPMTFGGMAGLVIKSGDDEVDLMAAKLLDYMSGGVVQSMTVRGGGNYATRYSAVPPAGACVADPGCVHNDKIREIWDNNGLYDLGDTTLVFGGIIQKWLTLLQDLVTDNITPRRMLDEWEIEINRLIRQAK